METNEQIRQVLKNALEEELESFLEQVGQMTEGELKHLEEQVVKSSQTIGRKLMEGVLKSRLYERQQGACQGQVVRREVARDGRQALAQLLSAATMASIAKRAE